MSRSNPIRWASGLFILASVCIAASCCAEETAAIWRETGTLAAEEAGQAAAVDGQYFYAISSRTIGKYDRRSGQRVALSSGEATHLNSGFFREGKLYCAHSNYPALPERSEIFVLDPATMKLTVFHHFAEQPGSLTWTVWHENAWWCNFAFYGEANAKSYLARFDAQWHEQTRWTYPAELVGKLGTHSLSGGIWYHGRLLVTDHDNYVIYELDVPSTGGVLKLIATQPAPFAGQGIAYDPVTDGLIGIVRKKRQVVFAEKRGGRLKVMHEQTAH